MRKSTPFVASPGNPNAHKLAKAWELVEHEAKVSGLQVLIQLTTAEPGRLFPEYNACDCTLVIRHGSWEAMLLELLEGLGLHRHRQMVSPSSWQGVEAWEDAASSWAKAYWRQLDQEFGELQPAAPRCCAIKHDGHACTARRKPGSAFCGRHRIFCARRLSTLSEIEADLRERMRRNA